MPNKKDGGAERIEAINEFSDAVAKLARAHHMDLPDFVYFMIDDVCLARIDIFKYGGRAVKEEHYLRGDEDILGIEAPRVEAVKPVDEDEEEYMQKLNFWKQ